MSSIGTVNILIVDDNDATRAKLIDHLRYPDLRIVGESTFGAAAASWAAQLEVDVVIVTVAEPLARALRTIELLTSGDSTRPVIAVSGQSDRTTMRKAMLAGARDFVPLPAPDDDLRKSVLRVHQREQQRRSAAGDMVRSNAHGTIITVLGVKGGIGKTVTAVNIAAGIAQGTRHHVALVDADLQFGDCAVMLDVVPERTIADAVGEVDPAKPHLVDAYLTDHASHLSLIAAPVNPGDADQISPEDLGNVLRSLAATHDYVVIDTSPQLDAMTALAIDLSAIVLVMAVPEVPCIRRTRAALSLLEEAGYSRDKVKVVLNRTGKRAEVSTADVEAALGYPIYAEIPDDRAVARSVSVGVPVIMADARSNAARAFTALGRKLAGVTGSQRERSFLPWRRRRQDVDTVALPAPPNPAEPDALLAAWAPAIAAPAAAAGPAAPPPITAGDNAVSAGPTPGAVTVLINPAGSRDTAAVAARLSATQSVNPTPGANHGA